MDIRRWSKPSSNDGLQEFFQSTEIARGSSCVGQVTGLGTMTMRRLRERFTGVLKVNTAHRTGSWSYLVENCRIFVLWVWCKMSTRGQRCLSSDQPPEPPPPAARISPEGKVLPDAVTSQSVQSQIKPYSVYTVGLQKKRKFSQSNQTFRLVKTI